MGNNSLKSTDIEIALTTYFDSRRNFMIPNLKWGWRNLSYEIDLMVVSGSRYAYDIEIKISPGDLRRDIAKDKWNYCRLQHYFRHSYFAMPETMRKYEDLVPEHAGILLVSYNDKRHWFDVELSRQPTTDTMAIKVTAEEYAQLGRLCMIRMWAIKLQVRDLAQRYQSLQTNATPQPPLREEG